MLKIRPLRCFSVLPAPCRSVCSLVPISWVLLQLYPVLCSYFALSGIKGGRGRNQGMCLSCGPWANPDEFLEVRRVVASVCLSNNKIITNPKRRKTHCETIPKNWERASAHHLSMLENCVTSEHCTPFLEAQHWQSKPPDTHLQMGK